MPMIKREHDSSGSRKLGSESCPVLFHCALYFVVENFDGFLIYVLVYLGSSVIFLVVFVVLGMMMIWAYIKVRTRLHNNASPSPPPLPQCLVRACAYMFGVDW